MFKNLLKLLLPTSHYQSLNRVEIKKDNILHNFHNIQDLQPTHTIIPVVKSNAYGHGLKQISTILNTLANKDLPLIAVDSYPEYQIVADTTNKKILVLWETLPSNYHLYNPKRVHLAIGSLETLKSLIQTNKKRHIHLFLNTGMNREGFQEQTLLQALTLLQNNHKIIIVGVMSHLANADIKDSNFTDKQIQSFKKMHQLIMKAWHKPLYIHISNSAGLSKINDPIFTASRSWLALYGYNPLETEDPYYHIYRNLKPALRIISSITSLQNLKKGDGVNYELTRKAWQDTRIATLPIGYNEGLPRLSGNGYNVYNNNNKFPIIGRVCMNLSSIDIWKDNIKIWDYIEIIWYNENNENNIYQLAKINNTIPYTILTGIDRNLKRIII